MDEEAEHSKRRLTELGRDCNRLKEKIKILEKEKIISSEIEKRGKQRIFSLEDEIERMGSDQREKRADFSDEIRDLESAKIRAEDDIEIWKKKFKDSECGKTRAEDEVRIWKKKFKRRVDDEIEIWKKKKKIKDSECCGKRRAADEFDLLKNKCGELEIELEDYKNKCHGLSTMLKVKEMECNEFEAKLKNLVLTKVALDHELEDYNTTCNRMEEEITGLTDGGKIMPEREKTSNEGIACFEELVKKLESDVKYMLVQLKNENMVLERGIRRAEDETENWKKRFSELNMGLGNLQKEVGYDDICEKVLSPALLPGANFSSLHGNFEDAHVSDAPKIKNQCDHSANIKVEKKNICSELNVGLGNLQKEVGCDDMWEKYTDEYKTDGRVNVPTLGVAHLSKGEKVLSPAFLPSTSFSSLHGNLEDVHVPDTPKIKTQCDHSPNIKVEKKNICSDIKVELVSEARQQLGSETGVNCKENLVLLKQDSVTISSTCIIEIDSEDEVIEVSDGEDEKEIPLKHACNNKGEDVEHASTDGTLKTLNKYLNRPLSVWGSRDIDIPFSSPMKRCKISDTSGSVSQEADKFPNIKI